MLVEATSFAHTVSVKLKSSWKPFELASCGSQILNKKTQLNCLSQLNRKYIYTFLSSNFCKPTLDMTAKPEVSFLVLPISKGLKSSFMRGEALSWEKKENKSMEKKFQKHVSKPTFPSFWIMIRAQSYCFLKNSACRTKISWVISIWTMTILFHFQTKILKNILKIIKEWNWQTLELNIWPMSVVAEQNIKLTSLLNRVIFRVTLELVEFFRKLMSEKQPSLSRPLFTTNLE